MATESPTEPAVKLPIECIFRTEIRNSNGCEIATCRLLQQITGLASEHCAVDQSACEVCSRAFPSAGARLNPVLPSLLYQICLTADSEQLASDQVATAAHRSHLQRIRRWAAQNVHRPFPERRSTPGCDVVIHCTGQHRFLDRSIESVLSQAGVIPIVHLVDDATGNPDCFAHWAHHPQVNLYRYQKVLGWHRTLQTLIPRLKSSFLAVQDPDCVSRQSRLANAIHQLEEWCGEMFGSALACGSEILQAQTPEREYIRYLPRETLVFRRATLVDMGGFADRSDADAELVYRAKTEGRRVAVCPVPLVDRMEEGSVPKIGPVPDYDDSVGDLWKSSAPLRDRAIGFPMRVVHCDVVLPFYDRADFIHEAMESLLAQSGADLVVHLVDDAGPIADEIFRRYRGKENVRCYSNRENIGPFASFNNIASFAETELIAVQDADDISREYRMALSGNWLRLAGADIFGGRCETFGGDSIIFPSREGANDRVPHPRPKMKPSTYPRPGGGYFLENPTAMMRVDAFRQLGGYANFRQRERNRTGVDTEFYARAYFSEQRFAITRDILVDYRVHSASAMQSTNTGWGSAARAEAIRERRRRIAFYCETERFDPRLFGALNEFAGVTKRLSSKSVLT